MKKTHRILVVLAVILITVFSIGYIIKQNQKEEARKDCLRWISHDPSIEIKTDAKEDVDNYMYCMSQKGLIPDERDVEMLKANN